MHFRKPTKGESRLEDLHIEACLQYFYITPRINIGRPCQGKQMSIRTDRLGAEMQKEISTLLHNGLKNPNVGLASISRVDVSTDLSYATVRVSVLGSKQEQMKSLNALQQSAGFIRSHLAKLIKLRKFPELHFVFDENLQHAARIDEILHNLKEKGEL